MEIGDEIILHGNWEEIRLQQNAIYRAKGLSMCDKDSVENVPLNEILRIEAIHRDGDIGIDHPDATGYMYKECFIALKKNRRKPNATINTNSDTETVQSDISTYNAFAIDSYVRNT